MPGLSALINRTAARHVSLNPDQPSSLQIPLTQQTPVAQCAICVPLAPVEMSLWHEKSVRSYGAAPVSTVRNRSSEACVAFSYEPWCLFEQWVEFERRCLAEKRRGEVRDVACVFGRDRFRAQRV